MADSSLRRGHEEEHSGWRGVVVSKMFQEHVQGTNNVTGHHSMQVMAQVTEL